MKKLSLSQSFFVKVEGQCHSNHRNPQGVYKIDVVEEKTLAHSACAAIQIAREAVPFLEENLNRLTIRAFHRDGREVVVPRHLHTQYETHGRFHGRCLDHPEIVSYQ